MTSDNVTERATYVDEDFPEDWDNEDVSFLAKFINDELGAKLVADIEPDTEVDYRLLVESEGEDTAGVVTPTDLGSSRIDTGGLGQGVDPSDLSGADRSSPGGGL